MFWFILISFIVYFIPTWISSYRNHNNATSIFIMNLFLGWTFLGWVFALIWSYSDNISLKTQKDKPGYNSLWETFD